VKLEGDSILQYLVKLKDVRDQFLTIGREVDEEDMVVITLKIVS
jgi:hypothetical protein